MLNEDKQPQILGMTEATAPQDKLESVSLEDTPIRQANEDSPFLPAALPKQKPNLVSKEILNSVKALQNKTIERLDTKGASVNAEDRRHFFSKFYFVPVGLFLFILGLQTIVGFRLATHAAMAPLLSEKQSFQAQLSYADFLADSGKLKEAVLIYFRLAERSNQLKSNGAEGRRILSDLESGAKSGRTAENMAEISSVLAGLRAQVIKNREMR